MQEDQLDYLDDLVADVLDGNYTRVGGLSTGERLGERCRNAQGNGLYHRPGTLAVG